jgi:hypothetical protein
METRAATEWRELASDAVVSIYNKRFDGFVRVHPTGYVELTSPAGTVTARFRELEQADWLRASYVRKLVDQGVAGDDLRDALAAIERVDQRLAANAPAEALDGLLERSQQHFEAWCAQHGIDYNRLDEDQVTALIDQAIQSARSA